MDFETLLHYPCWPVLLAWGYPGKPYPRTHGYRGQRSMKASDLRRVSHSVPGCFLRLGSWRSPRRFHRMRPTRHPGAWQVWVSSASSREFTLHSSSTANPRSITDSTFHQRTGGWGNPIRKNNLSRLSPRYFPDGTESPQRRNNPRCPHFMTEHRSCQLPPNMLNAT